jgi:hypothetical protein
MEVQTRSEETGLGRHDTLGSAMEAARLDPTIWKISFDLGMERVRLVRDGNGWVYEPILNQW